MTAGTQPKAKAFIQLFSAGGAVLGSLIAPIVGGVLGRRPTYCALCALSLLVCGALFNGFHQYSFAFLAMVGAVGFSTASFYGWLPLYLPELFPTRVRATGQGFAFNFGRILAALGAWQMGPLMAFFATAKMPTGFGATSSYAKAGTTIMLIYVVGLAIIWLAPETKGKPLPE
jgi:MFS family permease